VPARSRVTSLLAAAASLAVASLALAPGAAAHQPTGAADATATKRAMFEDGVSVPVISSPNIRFVTNVPDTAGISGVFARSAPYFYVSSTDSITVYDISDPMAPRITGVLANLVFENEAMNYGEQKVGGTIERFVLVGADLVQVTPEEPNHVGTSNEVMVVDVTDPSDPHPRSRLKTTTNTHTVACIRDTACRYAYTAGRNGKFSIVDLTDLDEPKEVDADPATAGIQPFSSPAGGPNPVFTSGAGHKWNFDEAGYGIHTGSGGSAVFDVRDPKAPRLVATTDANGTASPWNDFIHHNADRPNAKRFTGPGTPSVEKGNVLLVTEEDYENTDCSTAGSFQSWHVTDLSGQQGTIRPLDRINPVDLGEGVATPHMAFCSAHWFDYHPTGIVAQGFYQGGLRLIDVRDPTDLKEYGYVASGLSEVWDAYWVPKRRSTGLPTTQKTNIVYTVDAVRGLDVYVVDLPGSDAAPGLLSLVVSPRGLDPAVTVAAAGLLGLAGLAVLRRRRLAEARVH
jgi:hypothetical protein